MVIAGIRFDSADGHILEVGGSHPGVAQTELEVLAGGEEQVGLQLTGEIRLVIIVGGIGVILDVRAIQGTEASSLCQSG